MQYRHVGRSGLQVSVLGFGSWVTFGGQIGTELAVKCLSAARAGGINFFDNAESYAQGQSERIMGQALAELEWPRHSYVISTKLFWGIYDDVNMRNTLNRKYLMQGIDGSLGRLGLDFVDILFCHRSDPSTPIEETVWAMSNIVDAGKALYWGTSEWPADDIRAAWELAERHHLHKPVAEQPQYNLLVRQRVEREYRALVRRYRPRADDVEPTRIGPFVGQVPGRHARREPSLAPRLRMAQANHYRREQQRKGTRAKRSGRRYGVRHGTARARLVRSQRACFDCDHGCFNGRTAPI